MHLQSGVAVELERGLTRLTLSGGNKYHAIFSLHPENSRRGSILQHLHGNDIAGRKQLEQVRLIFQPHRVQRHAVHDIQGNVSPPAEKMGCSHPWPP